jgi:hypothetical protein
VPILALGGDVQMHTDIVAMQDNARVECGFRPQLILTIGAIPYPNNTHEIYHSHPYWLINVSDLAHFAAMGTASSNMTRVAWHTPQNATYASDGVANYDISFTADTTGFNYRITRNAGFPDIFPNHVVTCAIGNVSSDVRHVESPGQAGEQVISTTVPDVRAALVFATRNQTGVYPNYTDLSLRTGVSIGLVGQTQQYTTCGRVASTHGEANAAVAIHRDDGGAVSWRKRATASLSGSDVTLNWSHDDAPGAVTVVALGDASAVTPVKQLDPFLYHLPM